MKIIIEEPIEENTLSSTFPAQSNAGTSTISLEDNTLSSIEVKANRTSLFTVLDELIDDSIDQKIYADDYYYYIFTKTICFKLSKQKYVLENYLYQNKYNVVENVNPPLFTMSNDEILDEISTVDTFDYESKEISDEQEETYVSSMPTPLELLQEYKDKINVKLGDDYYYVCKLKSIKSLIKEKKIGISAQDWNDLIFLKNLIRFEVPITETLTKYTRLAEPLLAKAFKILGDADLYISSETEAVYLENKKACCFIMPILLKSSDGTFYENNKESLTIIAETVKLKMQEQIYLL